MLVLANVWDPLSAAIVADTGLPALATASASIALSRGYDDGEEIPFDELESVVGRICSATELPVSVDFERGYGQAPADVQASAARLIAAGAVGVNIEDSTADGGLRGVDSQCDRIAAVIAAGQEAAVPIFVNARTDAFMSAQTDDGIARLEAYVAAGADGVYPILCNDLDVLQRIATTTAAPLNVLLTPDSASAAALWAAGVRRLSLGPGLLSVAGAAIQATAADLAAGDFTLASARMSTAEMRRIQGL